MTTTTTRVTPQTVVAFPVDRIVTGLNNRTVFKKQEIEELAGSIRKNGLIQPVTIRRIWRLMDGSIVAVSGARDTAAWEQAFQANRLDQGRTALGQLCAGERRLRAVLHLGWPTINAIVGSHSDRAAKSIMLVENEHRQEIDPIDKAHGYQSLIDDGYSMEQIADMAKRRPAEVQRHLDYLRLFEDAQLMLRNNPKLVSHFDLMTKLDHNRQVIALRAFKTGRQPTVAEFRSICGRLQSEQDQELMFAGLMMEAELVLAQAEGRRVRHKRFAVNPELPPVPLAGKGPLGNKIAAWIKHLEQDGYTAEARAVSTLLEQLLDRGKIQIDEIQL